MAKKKKPPVKKSASVKDKTPNSLRKAQKGKKSTYRSGSHKWEQLTSLGLSIREVTADGNCFFRAVSDQLYGSEDSFDHLRQQTVDFMETHEEDFAPFVEDDVTFAEYCLSMREDAVWAGNMELQALSLLVGCNICIHRLEEPRWYIRNFQDERTRTIHLSYHDGQHYNSVRLAADGASEAAQPIVIDSDSLLGASQARHHESSEPHPAEEAQRGTLPDAECVGARDAAEESVKPAPVLEASVSEAEDENEEARPVPMEVAVEELDEKRQGSAEEQREVVKGGGLQTEPAQRELGGCLQEKRVGRNQPCPCGSKRKFKSCCGTSSRVLEPLKPTRQSNRLRQRQQQQALQNNVREMYMEEIEPEKLRDLGALCI